MCSYLEGAEPPPQDVPVIPCPPIAYPSHPDTPEAHRSAGPQQCHRYRLLRLLPRLRYPWPPCRRYPLQRLLLPRLPRLRYLRPPVSSVSPQTPPSSPPSP